MKETYVDPHKKGKEDDKSSVLKIDLGDQDCNSASQGCVAQSVERWSSKPKVPSSNLVASRIYF